MRKQYQLIILIGILATSCSKDIKLHSLSFDATVNKANLNAGDSATFSFSGNPDFITFFSGEPGSRYEFKDRITDTSTNVQLKFSTATTTATNGTLSLLVSNNFSGAVNATNIAAATFTDITNRATLATGTATVASGTVSLADFAQQKKPVYIAFRYVAAAGAAQKKWTITGFTLNHVLTDKTYTIANMTATTPSPGFVTIDVKNPAVNWTAALVITGASTAALDTEDWAIAGPIDLSRVLPDAGTQIKTLSEGMNQFPFVYKYVAAGSYNAVFVATNANRDAQQSTKKTIGITVQ
ncbi:MAG TPA: DUF5017 domain-containing protein [Chitinophagaceae bacterium]